MTAHIMAESTDGWHRPSMHFTRPISVVPLVGVRGAGMAARGSAHTGTAMSSPWASRGGGGQSGPALCFLGPGAKPKSEAPN